ncbi:hypothetical protein BC832DRAFT_590695 [Gaertneriomyces semiglobifer]|nr:hypothetical protein BC832DRAFT_590695 [Gaertneriomyces semiglobifer]
MVPLIFFCDDVSGNVSKKWNAHYNWYFQLAGLPFEYTQLNYNVHFLATSNTLSPLQIGREVLQDVVSGLEKGINAYDVMQREEILAIGGVFLIECDNPMANELAAGIDIRRGLRFCRFCEVKRDATTVDGLYGMTTTETHQRRQWGGMQEVLRRRLLVAVDPRTTNAALDRDKKSTGIDCKYGAFFISKMREFIDRNPGCTREDVQGHMQVSFPAISVEDMISPMFRLGYGFSGHRHIPVEIFYTLSLGLIEYLMVASIKELSDKDQKVLTVRINALSSVGFPRPLRGNQLVQYVGSLQGKDRRAFVQVAVPVFQGLLSQKWLKAWQYLATVSVQLFSRRISDVDTYLDVLQRSLQAMMATIADINVSWLSAHAKYHTLAHVVENIREFGPAVLYMSEKFESFNKVMRNHAVHTNRHGPSVDVARRFARYTVVRHLLSGGMFKSEGRWSSPGNGLRQTFYDPIVQRVLGYKEEGKPALKLKQHIDSIPVDFQATCTAHKLPLPGPDKMLRRWKRIILDGKRVCDSGSFVQVQYQEGEESTIAIARIFEIIQIEPTKKIHVSVDLFAFEKNGNIVSRWYGHPILQSINVYRWVNVEEIVGPVNVQHCCAVSGCRQGTTQGILQERVHLTKEVPAVIHTHQVWDRFLVNLFCHNTPWLRDILEFEVEELNVREKIAVAIGQRNEATVQRTDRQVALAQRRSVRANTAAGTHQSQSQEQSPSLQMNADRGNVEIGSESVFSLRPWVNVGTGLAGVAGLGFDMAGGGGGAPELQASNKENHPDTKNVNNKRPSSEPAATMPPRRTPARQPATGPSTSLTRAQAIAVIEAKGLEGDDKEEAVTFLQKGFAEQLLGLKCDLLELKKMSSQSSKMVVQNFELSESGKLTTLQKSIRAAARKLVHNPKARRYINEAEGLTALAFKKQWGVTRTMESNAAIVAKVRKVASNSLTRVKSDMKAVLVVGTSGDKKVNDLHLLSFAELLFCTKTVTDAHLKRAVLMRAVVAAMERDYGQEEFGQSFWKTLDNSIRGSYDMRTSQELAEYFDRIIHNDKIKFTRAPMSSEKPREDPDELDLVIDTESVEFVYSHNVPPPADIMETEIQDITETTSEGTEEGEIEEEGTAEPMEGLEEVESSDPDEEP